MSGEPTVCLFCGMRGASTRLSMAPWMLNQYACGTVQTVGVTTGEVFSSHQSPGCREIVRLQDRLHALEQEQSHA